MASKGKKLVILEGSYKDKDGYHIPGESLELDAKEADRLIKLKAAREPEAVPAPKKSAGEEAGEKTETKTDGK